MSLWTLIAIARVVLALVALRGVRWAYVSFAALGLLYFPLKVGFHLTPAACELALNASLVRLSLQNFPHMALFAGFFMLSRAQFARATRHAPSMAR